MKIRAVFPIAIVVAGFMASANVYAASSDVPSTVRVGFSKTKNVTVSVRNDSGSQMELKIGDQVMSLAAGKTVAMKIPVGSRIIMNSATPTHEAGQVIAEVTTALNNATVAIK
jgi:hypothetical protein